MKFLKITESNGRKKDILLSINAILAIEESFSSFYKTIIQTSIRDSKGETISYHVSESIAEFEEMINEIFK